MSRIDGVSAPSYGLSAQGIAAQISSQQAQLADLQQLVASLLAEMQTLEPPQRPHLPTQGSPDHLVAIRRARMADYEAALRSFTTRLAQLNSRLQLAFRSMSEVNAKIGNLQQRMRWSNARELGQVERLEQQKKQIEEMRRSMENAARRAMTRLQRRDTQETGLDLQLVRTRGDAHLDGDGRADLRFSAFAFLPRQQGAGWATLQQQVRTLSQQVSTLSVLPAGEPIGPDAVADLDARFAPELTEQQVELVRGMLLNEQLPSQRAELGVWNDTARAMRIDMAELTARILGRPSPAELESYSSDYAAFVGQHGGRTSNEQQAEEFAWRLAAGHRLGDPTFFLQPTELPPVPNDTLQEHAYIRQLSEIRQRSWDGPLTPDTRAALVAATNGSTHGSSGADMDAFPVAGGLYNIGYDLQWDDFNQGTAHHSSDYGGGDARHQASGRGHPANDIFAPRGAPLVAPVDGTVIGIGVNETGGNWIQIQRGETRFYFAHMDAFVGDFKQGDTIAAGQQVGTVGNTGSARGTAPHLHIQITVGDGRVDPFPYLMAARERRPFAAIDPA